MPINPTTANAESATYFKFKVQEVQKQVNNKIITVKEPCFTQWNGTDNVYVANSFGGELYKVTAGEVKAINGKAGIFYAQDIFFEFHSKNVSNELVREVVVLPRQNSAFEKVISKLIGAKTFNSIDFIGGQYLNKETNKYSDYVLVNENGVKLDKLINFKYQDAKYPQPSNLIELPPLEYNIVTKKNPLTKQSEESKTIKEEWKVKADEIFDDALELIIANVESWREAHPKDYTPKVYSADQAGDLPDIDIETITNVQMPF